VSVNAKLIAVLSGIAPTAPGVYTGDEPKYIVFTYTLTGAMYADNVPQCLQYLIQVHYFCPTGENSLADRERIMRSLYEAGFGWPSEDDATDGNGQHYVYDCTYLEGLNRG
jgi:hypothetical protein